MQIRVHCRKLMKMNDYLDRFIVNFDKMIRVIGGVASASRPSPGALSSDVSMNDGQRRHSAALMRVNHVGEVCAQALYSAQGTFAKDDAIRHQFVEAGREEEDHLAWTAQRIGELGSRTSLLNPLWYGGAYAMGALAAKLGDAHSLGFVVETERQVEAHLTSHLVELPLEDTKSRAIVEQMRLDEIAHGSAARVLGATDMPAPLKAVMQAVAKIMTATAYRI